MHVPYFLPFAYEEKSRGPACAPIIQNISPPHSRTAAAAARELRRATISAVQSSFDLSAPFTSRPSTRYYIFSIAVTRRRKKKKPALGHLQLESSHNSSPTHNSFCVRYSAKSHFTPSDRVLWDLNIVFPLCSGTTSTSSNMNFHLQSLP